MLPDEIVQRLVDAAVGSDTDPNRNIFIGEAQESPDDCVVVQAYPTPQAPERTMGSTGAAPAADKERFQVLCRATSRQVAWQKAKDVRAALDWWDGALTGTQYHNVILVGSLGELEPDQNSRYRVVGSYEAWKARS